MPNPIPPELVEAVRSLGELPADQLALMRTSFADVLADEETYSPRQLLMARAMLFVIDRLPGDPVAALLEFDALLRAVEAGEREAKLRHKSDQSRQRRRRGH